MIRCCHQDWLLLVPILSLGCGAQADLESPRKFQAAESAFAKARDPGDYLRAASLYQEILDDGVTSSAVLYNLGNAFMKAGQRGRAIAAYRRALRYRPRDPYLNANLKYALGPEKIQTTRRSLLDTIFFWQSWLSYAEKFLLTSLALSTTLLIALSARLAPSGGKALLGRLTAAGVVLTVVAACSNVYDWYLIERIRQGVVVAEETVARKGNSDTYEPAFTQPLPEGTEFVVVEQRPDWLLIRLVATGEGWVPQRDVVTF